MVNRRRSTAHGRHVGPRLVGRDFEDRGARVGLLRAAIDQTKVNEALLIAPADDHHRGVHPVVGRVVGDVTAGDPIERFEQLVGEPLSDFEKKWRSAMLALPARSIATAALGR